MDVLVLIEVDKLISLVFVNRGFGFEAMNLLRLGMIFWFGFAMEDGS